MKMDICNANSDKECFVWKMCHSAEWNDTHDGVSWILGSKPNLPNLLTIWQILTLVTLRQFKFYTRRLSLLSVNKTLEKLDLTFAQNGPFAVTLTVANGSATIKCSTKKLVKSNLRASSTRSSMFHRKVSSITCVAHLTSRKCCTNLKIRTREKENG